MPQSQLEVLNAGDVTSSKASCSGSPAEILRAAMEEAYEKRDLRGMMSVGEQLDHLLIADAKAAYQRGVLPMFCDKEHALYRVVHPSTRTPGSVQITTYRAGMGALSDTTVRTIDDIAGEINYASWKIVPDADVPRILGELGAAEAAYQERVSRRRQSSSEHSVAPT